MNDLAISNHLVNPEDKEERVIKILKREKCEEVCVSNHNNKKEKKIKIKLINY